MQPVFVSGLKQLFRMKTSCPSCLSEIGLRRIIHGMPNEPVDEHKFTLAGCCLSDLNPMSTCVQCMREGDYVTDQAILDFE